MEYIIFLFTIQLPFVYLIWRLAQKQTSEVNRNMRILKQQNEHIANFMDTLRMSVEKISEDLYGNGKVNARMFQMEREIKELKKCFQQMEIYTGLNTRNSALEDLPSSKNLKGKSLDQRPIYTDSV